MSHPLAHSLRFAAVLNASAPSSLGSASQLVCLTFATLLFQSQTAIAELPLIQTHTADYLIQLRALVPYSHHCLLHSQAIVQVGSLIFTNLGVHYLLTFNIKPDAQHDTLPSRMSPSREEVFSPSFPSSYWPNNGRMSLSFVHVTQYSHSHLFAYRYDDGGPFTL